MRNHLAFIFCLLFLNNVASFFIPQHVGHDKPSSFPRFRMSDDESAWSGEVASNNDGQIMGCLITQDDDSLTDWTIEIDGVEADLAKFSEGIYKKLMNDASKEDFKGFRQGVVPPHLLGTYRAFTMDECCRETVLEAMLQNRIKPFDDAREEMEFSKFSIPPAAPKKKKKKKKRKKNNTDEQATTPEVVEAPSWRNFETMKEALDAGWKPGQSFSFVAKCAKGQKIPDENESYDLINKSNININKSNFDLSGKSSNKLF